MTIAELQQIQAGENFGVFIGLLIGLWIGYMIFKSFKNKQNTKTTKDTITINKNISSNIGR